MELLVNIFTLFNWIYFNFFLNNSLNFMNIIRRWYFSNNSLFNYLWLSLNNSFNIFNFIITININEFLFIKVTILCILNISISISIITQITLFYVCFSLSNNLIISWILINLISNYLIITQITLFNICFSLSNDFFST